MSAAQDCERDADLILSALAELQRLALRFTESSTAMELGKALWAAFVADAVFPWRLVETDRLSSSRLRRKRMLCFGLLDEIRSAIKERLAWASADEQFRANYMATAGGLPGVTGDWVPSKDFDVVFATSRRLLRERICTTPSGRMVRLR
jgi:hypothetical protein